MATGQERALEFIELAELDRHRTAMVVLKSMDPALYHPAEHALWLPESLLTLPVMPVRRFPARL